MCHILPLSAEGGADGRIPGMEGIATTAEAKATVVDQHGTGFDAGFSCSVGTGLQQR